ncbi:unnamed protein product [Phytomonas sp. Hart1]|nr:unnamed protein product [Phytomonas sp. Hart1]|eukprot:CCW68062.1 unnamed protein product [Phytomonas sp. isolate Hart1]
MLYQTLKVRRKAIPAEIKASYRKLALQAHPDRPGGSQGDFQKLQKAYEILMDAEKRAEYDKRLDKRYERLRNFTRPEPFAKVISPAGYKLADDQFYVFETAPEKVRCRLRYGDIVEYQQTQGCFVGLSADFFLYWCREGHDYATPLCHTASDFALSDIKIIQRSNLDRGKIHVAVPRFNLNRQHAKKGADDPSTADNPSTPFTAAGGRPNSTSRARKIWERLWLKEYVRMINQKLKILLPDEIYKRHAIEAEYAKELAQIQSKLALALRELSPEVSVASKTEKVADNETSSSHTETPFHSLILRNPKKEKNDFYNGTTAFNNPLSDDSIPNGLSGEPYHFYSTSQSHGGVESKFLSYLNDISSLGKSSLRGRRSLPSEGPISEDLLENSPNSSGRGSSTKRRSFLRMNNNQNDGEQFKNFIRRLTISEAATETDLESIISNEGINGTQRNYESEEEETFFQIHVVSEVSPPGSAKLPVKDASDLLEAFDSKNDNTTFTLSPPGASMTSFPSEMASTNGPLRKAAPSGAMPTCHGGANALPGGGSIGLGPAKPHPTAREGASRPLEDVKVEEVKGNGNSSPRVDNSTPNTIPDEDAGQLEDHLTPRVANTMFSQTTTHNIFKEEGKDAAQNGQKERMRSKTPLQGRKKAAHNKTLSFSKGDRDGLLGSADVRNIAKGASRPRSFDHLSAEELFQEEIGFIEEFMNQDKCCKKRR